MDQDAPSQEINHTASELRGANPGRGLGGPARMTEVQREMEQLRGTEIQIAKLVEQLFTTFAGVVSPREPVDPGQNTIEKEPGVSAPHASNLREVRNGFEKSIKSLKFLIASSEL